MLDSILLPPECRGYRHAPDFMGLWGKGWRGYVHRSPWSLLQSEHLWMPLLYSLKICPPSQLCGNSLGDFPSVLSSNRGGRQGRKEPKEPKVLALLAPPPPFTTGCMYHSPWWSVSLEGSSPHEWAPYSPLEIPGVIPSLLLPDPQGWSQYATPPCPNTVPHLVWILHTAHALESNSFIGCYCN